MRIVFHLVLIAWGSVFFLSSCDKDEEPQVYFDANGCEFSIPRSEFSHISLSWDGLVQRVDTVGHSAFVNPSIEEVYSIQGGTLSASCNPNQVWTIAFNMLDIDLDAFEICHLENGCNSRYLDDGEIYFSFSIWNFDEILASYNPIEHSSNFFYVEQEGGEESDMIFSYKVHLKQNGSFASRDIYPDTLIMETTNATAFYTIL